MIIKETGLVCNRSYCTAEHMEIKLTDTDALSWTAKLYIERIYHTPLSSWVFVTMNRETLCVNKAHPGAGQLAELAGRFMELTPEDEEGDAIYSEVEKLAGHPAVSALCAIWLDWQQERKDYINHLAAVECVENLRAKMQDDSFSPDVDTELFRAIQHITKDSAEALTAYLYGRDNACCRTCSNCGTALDHGEKCECEQTADKEKMIAAITELMQGATMSELEFVLGYLTA